MTNYFSRLAASAGLTSAVSVASRYPTPSTNPADADLVEQVEEVGASPAPPVDTPSQPTATADTVRVASPQVSIETRHATKGESPFEQTTSSATPALRLSATSAPAIARSDIVANEQSASHIHRDLEIPASQLPRREIESRPPSANPMATAGHDSPTPTAVTSLSSRSPLETDDVTLAVSRGDAARVAPRSTRALPARSVTEPGDSIVEESDSRRQRRGVEVRIGDVRVEIHAAQTSRPAVEGPAPQPAPAASASAQLVPFSASRHYLRGL